MWASQRSAGSGGPSKAGPGAHLGGVIGVAGRRGCEPVARAQRPVHDLDQAHHAAEGVVVRVEQQEPQVARGVAAAPPATTSKSFIVFQYVCGMIEIHARMKQGYMVTTGSHAVACRKHGAAATECSGGRGSGTRWRAARPPSGA